MKRIHSLFIVLLFVRVLANAQGEVKNESISTPLVGIHWGGNLPGGDLLARYGFLNNLGFSAGYKLQNQWYFGVDANFIFEGEECICKVPAGIEVGAVLSEPVEGLTGPPSDGQGLGQAQPERANG